jgi:predicted transcriptional regulator
MRRRGWHDTRYFQPTDYPQTRPESSASNIDVFVGGESAGTVTALGDYADARGILSLEALPEWEYASAGTVVETTITGASLRRALEASPDGILRVRLAVTPGPHANGINLYGAGRGGSPVPFTVLFDRGR